jgi:1-deoxy-D-xylulose 5-phosphate reductoisomerase
VSVAEALAHPTWAMGGKISIDSATMMNKGLELMEAHHLFGTPYERIEVVVHPQSLVHGLVRLGDGALLAHLGPRDMRIAISYALHGGTSVPLAPLGGGAPDFALGGDAPGSALGGGAPGSTLGGGAPDSTLGGGAPDSTLGGGAPGSTLGGGAPDSGAIAPLDLVGVGTLTFEAIDLDAFPCLRLAREAALAGGTAPCVLNAANEVAVHAFLSERLPFNGISAAIEATLERLPGAPVRAFESLYEADHEARAIAAEAVAALA